MLAPGTEGGWTLHQPDGEKMTIYDAGDDISKRRRAAGDSGGQGVWFRFFARLGGQGHVAAGRGAL